MIIYSDTKDAFLEDVLEGRIDERIESAVEEKLHRRTGRSEMDSWRNSLSRMSSILGGSSVPGDATVSLEYNIPYTSKRVDMIVSGLTEDDRSSAVIIELKQWTRAEAVPGKDCIVSTALGGGMHETTHPCYQAWSYAMAIADFNEDVRDNEVLLMPCAYLHNYEVSDPEPLLDPQYGECLENAPMFSKHDGRRLREFLERFIRKGDSGRTILLIDEGRLRPSKSLQDVFSSMMEGNREFTLLDSQKVVYEEILARARVLKGGDRRTTVIVEGGPGTGKTVLAVNLLYELICEDMAALYVSKNAAPRNVYESKLRGGSGRGGGRIRQLFVGSGKFTADDGAVFDALITDEAHRLNERSGLYSNLGENQVMEIIRASRLSVFFIDEDQRVTLKDIGTVGEIRRQAERLGSDVEVLYLDSQFRCSGSDGYLEWLDRVLEIKGEEDLGPEPSFSFDFRVYDDPVRMRDDIVELNRSNGRSRMVAGYCWNWDSKNKNNPDFHDVTIPGTGFGMSWNLGSTGTWAIDAGSENEIGCIHTCQGLEFDYVGVVIGDDMRYENGAIVTDASERARTDQSLRGLNRMYPDRDEARRVADRIIKDTYRVLMTRGMKGCFVYCTDPALSEHLKAQRDAAVQDGTLRSPSLRIYRLYGAGRPCPSLHRVAPTPSRSVQVH